MHGAVWLLIPLMVFLTMRGRWGGRARWGRRLAGADPDYVAELRRVVEAQQAQIESLEARIARTEEGLDFAERVLGQQARGGLAP